MATKRLQKELIDAGLNPLPNISAEPIDEDDYFKWSASLIGPENTPYAGGKFVLSVLFP